MQPQQPSKEKKASRGFTLMIMGSPGQKPRRIYVPHWAFGVLLLGWLSLMTVAAWFGFESLDGVEARGSPSEQAQATKLAIQRADASSTGLAAEISGKSVGRSAPASSPRSRQE